MSFSVMVEHDVLDFLTEAASVKVQEPDLSSRCVPAGSAGGAAWMRGSRVARKTSGNIARRVVGRTKCI